MKIIITILSLVVALLFNSNSSYAQQQPQPAVMSTRVMFTFYKNSLGIDSVKAEQVLQIMLNYKTGIKQLGTSQTLNAESKGLQITALIAEKNRQLEAILTKEQQAKIIPTSERETPKPTNQPQSN